MKLFLLLLCLPFMSLAQTIHFKDDTILYEGAVSLPELSTKEVAARFVPAIAVSMDKETVDISSFPGQNRVVAKGAISLNTPFHIIRKVQFTLQLTAAESSYTYRIDSVSVTEQRRGSKPKTKSSEELLEGMEETGASGTANERLLNEIDLRFQKLLAVLQRSMQMKAP